MLRLMKAAIRAGVRIAGYDIRSSGDRYNLVRPRQWGRDYVADVREIARSHGEPVKTVFVVGAFHGGGSKEMLSAFPGAEVHSFEPDPETYASLCEELRPYSNARNHQLAIGESVGRTVLHVTQARTTNSLLVPNPDEAPALSAEIGSVEIEVSTLDSFCETHGIGKVDFALCDVQGYELHLLRGARRMLAENRITTILLEACFDPFYEGQATLAQLYDLMVSHNYRFVCMQGLFFDGKPYPRSGNAIFTKTAT